MSGFFNQGFDEYIDSIKGAQVLFLKSGPSVGGWGVDWCPLHRTALQFGSDGGARIVHGLNDPDLTTLIIQVTELNDRITLDGKPMQRHRSEERRVGKECRL